jgi:exopolysaccharide biosynthesis polyprenyl glycosylphosphotransferase
VFEEKSLSLRDVTAMLDVISTIIMFMMSYWIREMLSIGYPLDFLSHLALIPMILALWLFFLTFFGAYQGPRTTSLFDYGLAIFKTIAVGLALVLTVLYLFKIQYVSRIVITLFATLDFLVLTAIRAGIIYYFRRSLQKGENHLTVLIIGTGKRAKKLTETLKENVEWGLHIVGYLDPDPDYGMRQGLEAPVLGTVGTISTMLKNNVVDCVFFAIPRSLIPNVDCIVRACEEEGVKLCLMADVFDVNVARMTLFELGSVPLLSLEPVALNEAKLLAKRLIDLFAALLFLPLLLPLIAVIAVAIKLNSPGPVYFIQERVGRNKRHFRMYKFRTMAEGSDKLQAQFEHMNEAEGPIFKIRDDPRITKVGKFLRRTSLDELPQIFNVIKNEMSLVGPRPMSLRDVSLFDKGIQRRRFSVKPGLTCLWQVSGRSQLPFSKWLELDLYYIDHWSLALDIKILLKTIPAVLGKTGAV